MVLLDQFKRLQIILKKFPHLDLDTQKAGILGKLVKLAATLRAGDRIEIFRAILYDPQTVTSFCLEQALHPEALGCLTADFCQMLENPIVGFGQR